MTLRLRWAFSILAILLLFALNLGVYFWGNARQTELILDLKTALESKDLVVEIRDLVARRQRDTEVMEPLVTTGAVRLDTGQLEDIRSRTREIEGMIERLHGLSHSSSTARLGAVFRDLAQAWLDVYETSVPLADPVAPADPAAAAAAAAAAAENEVSSQPFTYVERYAQTEALLAEQLAERTVGVEQAEQDFAAVAELADRITLAIFVASSLLTVGIAIWFSRFLRAAFARYVTSEVVDNVLKTASGLELGGEKREITILMADLRGFSSMSERIAPEKVVSVINNFLGVMTEIIVASGGMIDEFIGDAILVIFGAPLDRQDHAEAAVKCAIRMQLAMLEVNERNRSAGLPTVEMGIGVHSGEVVVGNIGSAKRTKYGAVGPSVNLAARIEANTVGGQILISEATFDQVSADLRVDDRLEIHPKGFEEPVVLLDIGGLAGRDGDPGLVLPEPGESLVRPAEEIAVRFVVMEGSRTGTTVRDGELLSLSHRAARVRTSADVAPLANLRLELLQGSDAAATRSLFAKVLSVEPRDDTFIARFTSVDPETAALLERLLNPPPS
ncbi:MAG: adenylate/guanylate cyclase domain-containing protein [bacterium]|nr:adenylate/guanylate cyclase domain-containing protein [bacterium]